MSVPELSKFLQKSIIDKVLKGNYRVVLNKKPTVLQLSPDILSRNVSKDVGNDLYYLMVKILKTKSRKYTTKGTLKRGPMWVEEGNSFAIIAKNYDQIQKRLSNTAKHKDVIKLIGHGKSEEISALDVGHVGGYGLSEKNTPLSYKLSQANAGISKLEKMFDVDLSSTSTYISNLLNDINNAHAEFVVESEKSYAAAGKLTGRFKFIFTVPQYWEINQRTLGDIEKNIYNKAVNELKKNVLDLKTSKTYMQIIDDASISAFNGKKQKSYSKSAKVSKKIKSKGKAKVATPKLRIKDTKGKFTSLLSLQGLLNTRLHDQIQQNMGKGRAKEILNYRTGRFAKSAKVTALQQRDDKIVAFYTYMRNPYDTFAPGGRLHKPGRDPNRIIGRSIRQLATQLVHSKFKVYPKLG